MTKHTYKATVTRDGRWWMVRIPEIGGLTQARRLNEVKPMASSLIAVTLNIPADSFDVDLEVERVGTVQVAEQAARLRSAREPATRL